MKEAAFRKYLACAVAGLGLLIGLACVVYQYRWYGAPREIRLSDYQRYDSPRLRCTIESIHSVNADYIHMKGWAVIMRQDVQQFNTSLVLYAEGTDVGYCWPMKMAERTDVTKRVGDGHDYDASGFEITLAKNRLSALPGPEQRYRIGLLYDVNGQICFVPTDQEFAPEE